MIRTLLIIAGASLVLAIVTLGGAAAIGGRDMARNGWAWEITEDGHDSLRVERVNGANAAADEPEVTRTLPWTGGEVLTLSALDEVIYVQGGDAGVVVTGPAAAVQRVTLAGGMLDMADGDDRMVFGLSRDGIRARSDNERVRVVVTAPSVNRFEIRGSTDLSIRNYDQAAITVDIAGSGDVDAAGQARTATIDIAGSGEADLSALRVADARVSISGSGEARVGPTGEAEVDISGSGDVELTTRPARLRQSVSGSGMVHGG